ncbi:hypothetical protein SETIT_2G073700v2 [Setaria italica]|uniref:F-box domain-containing protein n=1 Tax=Setaria italica TaxID=4555 RepID=K4A145_SETIT|nr:hypothetical protein SETIT_2G073700v2 [Setaria italica]
MEVRGEDGAACGARRGLLGLESQFESDAEGNGRADGMEMGRARMSATGGGSVCRAVPEKRIVPTASGIGVLPLDAVYEILLRLPADELCRLRLVCRSWQSLTSDPGFTRAHASRHPLLAGVHIACRTGDEIRIVDLFSGDIVRRIVPTVQPRYGMNAQLDLVCVSAMSTHQPNSVLNLATGEVVATFLPNASGRDNDIISPLLLGHIPSTGEFKVFYYSHLLGEDGAHGMVQTCCVATLVGGRGGRRWRATPSPPAVLGSCLRDSVVVGGVAYILFSPLYNQRNNHANLEPDAMALFDMAVEETGAASGATEQPSRR